MKLHPLLSLLDLFFLTRPIVIVPVWGFAAFGAYRFACQFDDPDPVGKYHPLFLSLDVYQYVLIFLYSLAVGAIYVINQIADYEVDKDNDGFPLLVRGGISMRAARATAVICALASIVGPWVMGFPEISLLSIIAIVAGCIYSCKPFSLSGRPFFDFLTNAFEAALAFAAGWFAAYGGIGRNFGLLVWLADFAGECIYMSAYAAPYFLLMCAGSIGSTLPDVKGDALHDKITTAVRFGPRTATAIALGALIAAIPVSLLTPTDTLLVHSNITRDWLALGCAALSIPFYIVYMIRPTLVTMELTYKAGGAVTMLAASIAVPLLVPAGAIIYFITRLYFRKRHNAAYPSLTPGAAE